MKEMGWTDEAIEKTIEDLLEVKSKTFSESFEYQYPTVLFGWRKKHVDYTYVEREERYAISETTPTGLQVSLTPKMADVEHAEARSILMGIYAELSEIVKPLL